MTVCSLSAVWLVAWPWWQRPLHVGMTTCRSSECTSTPTPAITIYNSVGNKSLETCTIVFLTGDPSTSETLCKAGKRSIASVKYPTIHVARPTDGTYRYFSHFNVHRHIKSIFFKYVCDREYSWSQLICCRSIKIHLHFVDSQAPVVYSYLKIWSRTSVRWDDFVLGLFSTTTVMWATITAM